MDDFRILPYTNLGENGESLPSCFLTDAEFRQDVFEFLVIDYTVTWKEVLR